MNMLWQFCFIPELTDNVNTFCNAYSGLFTIFTAYKEYKDINGFASVVSTETILANDGTLSIPLYVAKKQISQQEKEAELSLSEVYQQWQDNSVVLRNSLNQLFSTLK